MAVSGVVSRDPPSAAVSIVFIGFEPIDDYGLAAVVQEIS
jgi:hypothetical protein